MNIVMPLAGRGSSFLAQGIKTPKPLIKIRGKPMIKWATDAISFLSDPKYIFIVRKDHLEEYKMDNELYDLYKGSDVEVLSTNGMTDGAACTVLLARKLIDSNEELIVYNPDQFFSSDLEEKINEKTDEIKGIIPVFYATHPKWSYVKTNTEGCVVRVREKEPVSTQATVGLYYFSQGSDFVWAADEMIKKNARISGAFYVAPTYNQMIERGDKVITAECEFMWGLGTPEEVHRFEKYYKG